MQRAGGDVVDVGLGHVVALNPLEDLSIDMHLAVSAILFAAGVDAEEAELAEAKSETESGKDRYGQRQRQNAERIETQTPP